MNSNAEARSTREVFEDHLRLASTGEVEEDLLRNYAPDVVILIADGVRSGHEGARELANRLAEELPQASLTYTAKVVEGDVALLEWTGYGENGARVEDGCDTFVIRDGLVRAQSIHYTVLPDPTPI